jgi:hypothetical protein
MMTDTEDEMPEELDFSTLRIHKMGRARKSFQGVPNPDYVAPTEAPTVTLAPDVAAFFPDTESVNEALRSLIQERKVKNGTVLANRA